jgi:hypothetical protein
MAAKRRTRRRGTKLGVGARVLEAAEVERNDVVEMAAGAWMREESSHSVV